MGGHLKKNVLSIGPGCRVNYSANEPGKRKFCLFAEEFDTSGRVPITSLSYQLSQLLDFVLYNEHFPH
jgi:hypothetical protein